ncbi:MAG TPA: preprotein translocase subunit SecE [Pseudolabrys sp.]|jgi:preprotein translocase subunit SecE|nr:preprotein translocase subunit SecE [Pseudolabrys sp.]
MSDQMSDQAPVEARRKRVGLFRFLQEVREETRKVTWPSRRETMITTAMVFVMVAIASVFFLVADQLIRIAVTFVLGMAS